MLQICTPTLLYYSVRLLQGVDILLQVLDFHLRVAVDLNPPTKLLILDFPYPRWSTSLARFLLPRWRCCYRRRYPDRCRPMFSPRYGVMWSAVVPCLCWGGQELPESWKLEESLKSKNFYRCYRDCGPRCRFRSVYRESQDGYERLKSEPVATDCGIVAAGPHSLGDGGTELSKANTMFWVVNSLGIPVRGLFFLMLLFGRGNWSSQPHCVVAQKAAHLDAFGQPRLFQRLPVSLCSPTLPLRKVGIDTHGRRG